MLFKSGKSTREFLGPLFSFLYFGGVFNKTIIPLALVGYEMIIANSYPKRARGIILKFLPNNSSMACWFGNRRILQARVNLWQI